jgi:hypothetical protein
MISAFSTLGINKRIGAAVAALVLISAALPMNSRASTSPDLGLPVTAHNQ